MVNKIYPFYYIWLEWGMLYLCHLMALMDEDDHPLPLMAFSLGIFNSTPLLYGITTMQLSLASC